MINLEADGSAMYTLQSLWTQAREGLDVTTIDLRQPLLRDPQPRALAGGRRPSPVRSRSRCSTSRVPDLDFVALAHGMGVPAERPEDGEALVAALERALAEPGPHLIEAVVPSGF